MSEVKCSGSLELTGKEIKAMLERNLAERLKKPGLKVKNRAIRCSFNDESKATVEFEYSENLPPFPVSDELPAFETP